MLRGDFETMALADVLQWVDATNGRVLIDIETAGGHRSWIVADKRMVVGTSPPPKQGRLAAQETAAGPGPARRAVALARLLDLFLASSGSFSLHAEGSEGFQVPEGTVPLDVPVAFLLMEGLRLLDEWPAVRDAYPQDDARLAATDRPVGEVSLDPIDEGIRRLAEQAPALGEARLVLGLSRPTLLRRVHRLRNRGLVDVEGTPHGPDVEASIVDQAELLMRQEQYAEAAHVFRTLLASNPTDGRVAALLAESERLFIQDCYRQYGVTDILSVSDGVERERLQGTSQVIVDCLARPRALAVLVLVSPLRELETLSTVLRLIRRGTLIVETAD
ncbi:MAG: DUF4388 domain-containing protein [Sandaracinaceae bacterium]